MATKVRFAFALLLLVVFSSMPGCSSLTTSQEHASTSVMDYLYPDKKGYVEHAATPVLNLPVRVGIAFVPTSEKTAILEKTPLSEEQKQVLMDKVATEFEGMPYVKDIQRIPTMYLKPQGGFDNLRQLRTMYGTDVIALISYDQVQHTDEGLLSILYWTLVGAYVVKGEKNDTSTMIDAAVYDIQSGKMLFRAPGLSHIKGNATPINLSEELRGDSYRGFDKAAGEMVVNLKAELERFKEKVKQKPEEFRVVKTSEYRGGGALDLPFAAGVFALFAFVFHKGRRRWEP